MKEFLRPILLISTVLGPAAILVPETGFPRGERDGHSQSSASSQTSDSAAVMAAVTGFKAALKEGDSTKAISFLHPELIVFESRRAENLSEYRSGHLAADINHLRTVTQTTTRETLQVAGDMALYTSLFSSSGTSRGRQVNSNGTETMVLSRTNAGWKILHIHW